MPVIRSGEHKHPQEKHAIRVFIAIPQMHLRYTRTSQSDVLESTFYPLTGFRDNILLLNHSRSERLYPLRNALK